VTSPDRQPKARFSDRVDDYVRYRPGYSVEVVRTLESELGIVPRKTRVVDIGSGTGISAQLFLREGYDVTGVEPNAAMRHAAESLLASWGPQFRSVEGSAEATTLRDGSADLIVAAQAFHWFDVRSARVEMLRVVGAGGALALMWNDRQVETRAFLRAYDEAIRTWSIDYAKVDHKNLAEADIVSFFGPAGCESRTFPQFQEFDWQGLLGRALSSSYVPLRGQPGHDELVAALRQLFDAHAEAGKVRFDYDTKLYFGRFS
jgi:SAM-dependent methyltransferase